MPGTPRHSGGLRIRCLNHLSRLLSVWRSSGPLSWHVFHTHETGSRLFRFYLLNTLTFKNREHAHDCLNGNTWMHTCTVSPGESRAGRRGKSDWQDALWGLKDAGWTQPEITQVLWGVYSAELHCSDQRRNYYLHYFKWNQKTKLGVSKTSPFNLYSHFTQLQCSL